MVEQFIAIILVAVVLGADSFSLAMGMGLKGVSHNYELKFSWMVGIFHVLMPLIGLNLGIVAGHLLGFWAGRLGAAILAYIGVNMLWKAYRETKPKTHSFGKRVLVLDDSPSAPDGWINLTFLTTTVSIDALTVGFSLGTLFEIPVVYTVLVIGVIAGFMTLLGFKGGKLFSRLIGSYAQMAGGIVLLGLAFKMTI